MLANLKGLGLITNKFRVSPINCHIILYLYSTNK